MASVIHCTLHYLLSVSDFSAALPNDKKMMCIGERPDEAQHIADLRDAGMTLVKARVRLGLQSGTHAVVGEAANYERERSLIKLLEDLMRYAEPGQHL